MIGNNFIKYYKDWQWLLLWLFLLLFFLSYLNLYFSFYNAFKSKEGDLPSLVGIVKFNDVITEYAKGHIDLIYIGLNEQTNQRNLRIYKSYPVDLLLTYNGDLSLVHKRNIRLLKTLLVTRFENCDFRGKIETCFYFSEGYREIESDFIRGEMIKGIYRNTQQQFMARFNFSYFIQDADGHSIREVDKIWPIMNRAISQTKPPFGQFFIRFRMDDSSLRIVDSAISTRSSNSDAMIAFYKTFSRWTNEQLFKFQDVNIKPKFQLLHIYSPRSYKYKDIFYKYGKEIIYTEAVIKSLTNYFENGHMTERFLFNKYWYLKYNKIFFSKEYFNSKYYLDKVSGLLDKDK